jgi:hypothetical protein
MEKPMTEKSSGQEGAAAAASTQPIELSKSSDAIDGQEPTKAGPIKQACVELLREDICANTSAMIATLEAALAMHAANDDTGLLYGLRRARSYWKYISLSAAEFSALRQEGGARP